MHSRISQLTTVEHSKCLLPKKFRIRKMNLAFFFFNLMLTFQGIYSFINRKNILVLEVTARTINIIVFTLVQLLMLIVDSKSFAMAG